MELHPQILKKEGKQEFVVLPIEEYQLLMELVHDYEDLRDLREAKEESKDQESVSLEQATKDLAL